jgi:dipeptidyl aminopeptidase/acylaminoacyl peptidase
MIYNRGGNREFSKITMKYLKGLSYLSSKNYVVLASQYRGNDGGQGREEFGGKDVNDVLNLIIMAKSLSFVKQDKIVMLGFSRGGMMTYLAIKHGAKIKAAAVVGGVANLIQLEQEREFIGEKVLEQLIIPHNREEYKKRSAYYWPERINVPVLILHGEDDWRVNVTQAKKLSKKLTELGKVHELVVFPKGDHVLRSHRPEKNRLIFEWFDKYLKQ